MVTASLMLLAAAAIAAGVDARNPKVVRRDWSKMTQGEREKFTSAVNTLKMNKEQMPGLSYDDLVLQHREAYRTPAPWAENPAGPEEPDIYYRNGDQKGPAFLPWHRQQLIVYEEALQKVSGDPNMGIPYWNYMVDAFKSEPASTELWTADKGIGGNGRAEDRVVADGPFALWPLRYADLGETYLERNLGGLFSHPGDAADFVECFEETVYDEPPYSGSSKKGFRNFVEGFHGIANSKAKVAYPAGEGGGCTDEEECGPTIQLHAAAHAFIGASMINSTSPNDPAFFMLHAFTDALWESWQVEQLKRFPGTTHDDHFQPHHGGPLHHNLHDAMVKLDGVSARDVLDFNQLGYVYDELPVPAKILRELLAVNATRTRAQGSI